MSSRPSDIIVVGAGIVGCAVAYELSRRGASVQVVDERPVGMGATQASAGVLAPFIEAAEESPFLELAVRSLGLFDEFIERVVADSGSPVAYRRTGTLNVALHDDGLPKLRATAALLGRRGVFSEMLDSTDARRVEPHLPDDAAGALLIPTQGFVRAGDLTRALATAARRHGTPFVEGGRVRRIAASKGEVIVETSRGTLSGTAVVLAAGSWSGQIEIAGIDARPPVRPVRGQLLHVGWNGASVRRVTWGDRCYLVPWDDGTMLIGATVEEAGFDERATVAGVRDLLEAACELVPHAWTATFLGARVGLRPGTRDDLPIIGPSSVLPNLMYATGHYRNGVLLAPLTAQFVAEALLEDRLDPGLAFLMPQRFGKL